MFSSSKIKEEMGNWVIEDDLWKNRVLVINCNGEFEWREDLFKSINDLVYNDDIKVLAVSKRGKDYMYDCCDNCGNQCFDDYDEIYFCSANKDNFDCGMEDLMHDMNNKNILIN